MRELNSDNNGYIMIIRYPELLLLTESTGSLFFKIAGVLGVFRSSLEAFFLSVIKLIVAFLLCCADRGSTSSGSTYTASSESSSYGGGGYSYSGGSSVAVSEASEQEVESEEEVGESGEEE